jgi:hypothetical protein
MLSELQLLSFYIYLLIYLTVVQVTIAPYQNLEPNFPNKNKKGERKEMNGSKCPIIKGIMPDSD